MSPAVYLWGAILTGAAFGIDVLIGRARKRLEAERLYLASRFPAAFGTTPTDPEPGVTVRKRKPFNYEKDNRYGQ